MAKKPDKQSSSRPVSGLHADGTSRAVSAALNDAYRSVVNEPVPDRLKSVVERIREAERRAARKP
ncbi:MAG: hypothetical protein KDA53_00935 [Hyphomonas sp.]|nr:hypothetical protein [Hyphomonas sp.]